MTETAYIVTSQDEEKVVFQKTNDPQAILMASQAIFAENQAEAMEKAAKLYPVYDDDFIKYPLLFLNNHIQNGSRYDTFEVNLNPDKQISKQCLYYRYGGDDESFQQFIAYIKDKGSFDFSVHEESDWFTYYFHQSHIRKEFSSHGIFVRPVSKILEYNPKRAARQYKTLTAKKSEKSLPEKIWHKDIDNLQDQLKQLAHHRLPFFPQRTWNTPHSKKSHSYYAIVLIAIIQKTLIPATCYRQLKIFQEIKEKWKKLDNKSEFNSAFIRFMDKEVNIRKPKHIAQWSRDVDAKRNEKFWRIIDADL